MKKIFLIGILLFIIILQLYGSNVVAQLNEVYKAPYIIMDEEYIFIFDYKLSKFVTYARNDFRKISEFGRRGEGPGEILNSINSKVTYYNGSIYISHFPRVSIYSIKGKLKSEIKGPPDSGSFIPLGNNFVGVRSPQSASLLSEKSSITYCLYNHQLEKIKDVLTIEFRSFARRGKSKMQSLWLRDYFNSIVYKDRLFIGNTDKGFYLAVFDMNGNQLYEINRHYQKRIVTDEYKTFVIDSYRKAVGEQGWDEYKTRSGIIFPEFFPAYSNFAVADNKVYFFLYPDNPYLKQQEVCILNLKGELLKKKTINLSFGFFSDNSRLSIYNGKHYYLYDNEETEKWEIRFLEIDG